MDEKPTDEKTTTKGEKPATKGLKTAHIQIRATKTQKKVLAKAAKKAGIGLSTWMLMVSLAAANGDEGEPPST